jgi:hypothetical protein
VSLSDFALRADLSPVARICALEFLTAVFWRYPEAIASCSSGWTDRPEEPNDLLLKEVRNGPSSLAFRPSSFHDTSSLALTFW